MTQNQQVPIKAASKQIQYRNQILNKLQQNEGSQQSISDSEKSEDSCEEMKGEMEMEKEERQFNHVKKLVDKRRKFKNFQKHIIHLQKRAATYQFEPESMKIIQSRAHKIPRLNEDVKISDDLQKDADQEIAEIKEKIRKVDFQKMIALAEDDLVQTQRSNLDQMKMVFQMVGDKFREALAVETALGKGINLIKKHQSLDEFLAYVEPFFVQDLVQNVEWYKENLTPFHLNIQYPCKMQIDCLKEIERLQQRRNDQKYRKILDQMDQLDQIKALAEKGDERAKEELKKKERELGTINLNVNKRSQIAQEDALCAICGIGDYEDNDQIVFCFTCSMPVHQSCFGLETIPETDWVCNNCATYKLQRGLMIKCILCPKRGGAMKPTNIFSSYEKYYDQKKMNLSRRQGKKSIERSPCEVLSQNSEEVKDVNDLSKTSILQRIEPNNSLSELLTREEAYFKKTLKDYDDKVTEIELAKSDVALGTPKINEQMKVIKKQEELELNFNQHEIQNHRIPEDYSNFIKRNQGLLELEAPPTDTLYHWVHHSCALWMKEPVVTPKTSVNMKKMDFQRFSQLCFICCKKGSEIGACVKCCKTDCQVSFHVECAKRANYCMEIEKKQPNCSNRERIFKIFCESHRPFKILQIINDQNQKEIEDILKFTKCIEKAVELQKKHILKPKKIITKTEKNKMLRQALQNKKAELVQLKKDSKLLNKPRRDKRMKMVKAKKWTKNDIKTLMARVKEKYLAIIKMRINLVRMDPMIAEKKRYNREVRRLQKQEEKRKKQEYILKQRLMLQVVNQERESIIQEKGLRNRIKQSEEDGKSVEKVDIDEATFEGGSRSSEHMEEPDENDIQLEAIESLITNPNKITLNLQSNQEEEELGSTSQIELPELRDIPEFFKHASPLTISELEWTVTLSRYDFPWNEIRFEPFSAMECYKMYRNLVKDPQSFLKKVLGEKQKFQKIMYNQLNGLPTYDTMLNMKLALKNSKKQGQTASSFNPAGFVPTTPPTGTIFDIQHGNTVAPAPNSGVLPNQGILINPYLYCKCKGANRQEFMVYCESGEDQCVNGGWLHPECTKDLHSLTQEQIDAIEVWYCEDCQLKQNEGQEPKILTAQSSDRKPRKESEHRVSQERRPLPQTIISIPIEDTIKNQAPQIMSQDQNKNDRNSEKNEVAHRSPVKVLQQNWEQAEPKENSTDSLMNFVKVLNQATSQLQQHQMAVSQQTNIQQQLASLLTQISIGAGIINQPQKQQQEPISLSQHAGMIQQRNQNFQIPQNVQSSLMRNISWLQNETEQPRAQVSQPQEQYASLAEIQMAQRQQQIDQIDHLQRPVSQMEQPTASQLQALMNSLKQSLNPNQPRHQK